MVQIKESSHTAGPRTPRSTPVIWIAVAVAAALVVSLAIAAAKSDGFDRLLPKDQPFVPYFTT